jgi:hypothetical protein
MSRDDDARRELRDLETAAPGGLSAEDARRALEALRRGGLVVHELVQESDLSGAGHVLALVLGPPTSTEVLERIRDAWEDEREEVAERAAAVRRRAETAVETVSPAVERVIAQTIVALWKEFGQRRGGTFSEYLVRFHGFVEVRPDTVHFLRWRP